MENQNIVGVITPSTQLFHKWIAEKKKEDEAYAIVNDNHQLKGMEFTRIENGPKSEEVSEAIHTEARTRIKSKD